MAESSIAAAKAASRAAALSRREGLSAPFREEASRRIAQYVLDYLRQRNPGCVSAYWPIRSETDPRPILEALAKQDTLLALPRLDGGRMTFRSWSWGEPLVTGGFGLSEPPADAAEAVPDIVLTPLAAFDRLGGRIGYGKGYYDAALAALERQGPVIAVGLAFCTQETKAVPNEPHDRRLNAVITEAGPILIR